MIRAIPATLLQSATIATGLLIGALPALAHTGGTTYVDTDSVDALTVDTSLRDLEYDLALDADDDGALTFAEVDAAADRIAALAAGRLEVRRGTADCRLQRTEPLAIADYADGPYVRLRLVTSCAAGPLTLDFERGFEADPLHRVIVKTRDDGSAMLSADQPRWTEAETNIQLVARFAQQGIWHLITGYDHLAFLFVLMLASVRPRGGSRRSLRTALLESAKVVTGFTLAHSVTLVLAATGVVRAPTAPVEVAIAGSVMIAAVANLWDRSHLNGWQVASAFGLIHGLGFAGALAELLGEERSLLPLGAFNIGIELAQLAIAGIAVPLLWWCTRWTTMTRVGIPALSAAVACIAATWIAERLA